MSRRAVTSREKGIAPTDKRRFERMRVRKQFGKDFLSEIKQCVQKTDFLIKPKTYRPPRTAKAAPKPQEDNSDDEYPHVRFVLQPRIRKDYSRQIRDDTRVQKTMAPQIEDAEYERRGFGKPVVKDRSSSAQENERRFSLEQALDEEESRSDGRFSLSKPKAAAWKISSSESDGEKKSDTDAEQWNWKKPEQIALSESDEDEDEDEEVPQKPLSGPTARDRARQIVEPQRVSPIKQLLTNGAISEQSSIKSLPGKPLGARREADVISSYNSVPSGVVRKSAEPELDDELIPAPVDKRNEEVEQKQPSEEEEMHEEEDQKSDEGYKYSEEEETETRTKFMSVYSDEEEEERVSAEEEEEQPQGIAEYVKSLSIKHGLAESSHSEEEAAPVKHEEEEPEFKFSSSETEIVEKVIVQEEPVPPQDVEEPGIPVSVDAAVEHSFKFSTSTEENIRKMEAPVQPEVEDDDEESDSDFGGGQQFFETGTDDSSSEAYEVHAFTDTREEEIRQNRRKDRLIYSTSDSVIV